MKIIPCALIVLSLLAGQAWADAGNQVDHALAQKPTSSARVAINHPRVYYVGINGLGCPFCAYGLEKEFGKVTGIKQVEIDMQNGQVVLTMSQLTELSKDVVRKAVEKAGFEMRSFEAAAQE